MKILLLSDVFPPQIGGSGRWLWELYRRLSGFDVHVVASDAPGAEPFDATCPLPVHRLPLHFSNWGFVDPRGGLQYARTFFRLNRLVSRVRPDVLHCGKCLPEGLLGLLIQRTHGIPYVTYAHGEELTLAGKSRELRRLTRRVVAGAAAVIANTRHTREIIVKAFNAPEDKVHVLHPGVDASRFIPAPPDPDVRRTFGWAGRRVVLTVGALQKRKGQDMMIRALPAIRARCPDVLYAMVGEGWEKPYLEALVAEHRVSDLVQFRGIPRDDELIPCYQQCDLFALPNRQVDWDIEGFGIVLIEAQACGRAVIAGASGGTQEALEAGRTGELVSAETPERVADVVSGLLDDPDRRAEFGARGRQWVTDRFDWPILTSQAEGLFRDPVRAAQKNPPHGD